MRHRWRAKKNRGLFPCWLLVDWTEKHRERECDTGECDLWSEQSSEEFAVRRSSLDETPPLKQSWSSEKCRSLLGCLCACLLACLCLCVCVFACLLDCLHGCLFACLLVGMFACLLAWLLVSMIVCFACLHDCMLACLFDCFLTCVFARLHVCMFDCWKVLYGQAHLVSENRQRARWWRTPPSPKKRLSKKFRPFAVGRNWCPSHKMKGSPGQVCPPSSSSNTSGSFVFLLRRSGQHMQKGVRSCQKASWHPHIQAGTAPCMLSDSWVGSGAAASFAMWEMCFFVFGMCCHAQSGPPHTTAFHQTWR